MELGVGRVGFLTESGLDCVDAEVRSKAGDKYWSPGKLKLAFKQFLAAAESGDFYAFGIVGSFYDFGTGVKKNSSEALRWYRLAAKSGESFAANNAAVIWRDCGKRANAIKWFKKAIALGDGDANLNLAKMYLATNNFVQARHYLRRTCDAAFVTQGSKEGARRLLRSLPRV